MIRGLDDDEVDFLELVDRSKMNAEMKQILEDKKELEEFRQRVATLQEKSHDDKIQAEIVTSKPKIISNATKRLSQKSILTSGIVVKKRKTSETESSNGNNDDDKKTQNNINLDEKETEKIIKETSEIPSALKVIGILPGLGNYDSDTSSDCDDDGGKFDLLGRMIKKKDDCFSES